MSEQYPLVTIEQRDGVEVAVYAASAIGFCETALRASRQGIDAAQPPADFKLYFQEGHDNEPRILELFYAHSAYERVIGTSIVKLDGTRMPRTERGIRVEIPVGTQALIRGHADDIARHGPHYAVVEAKAVGASLWKEWVAAVEKADEADGWGADPFPRLDGLWQKYRDQIEVYMAGAGVEVCAFVVGRKGEGKKGEREVEEIRYAYVKPDPARLAAIKLKVIGIEAIERAGERLPEKCERNDYPCPYFFILHPKEKVEVERVEDDELAEAVHAYAVATQGEKTAKGLRDKAKKKLEELIAARNGDSAAPRFTVGTKYVVAGRAGEFELKLIERPQPEKTIPAHTQRYFDVKTLVARQKDETDPLPARDA